MVDLVRLMSKVMKRGCRGQSLGLTQACRSRAPQMHPLPMKEALLPCRFLAENSRSSAACRVPGLNLSTKSRRSRAAPCGRSRGGGSSRTRSRWRAASSSSCSASSRSSPGRSARGTASRLEDPAPGPARPERRRCPIGPFERRQQRSLARYHAGARSGHPRGAHLRRPDLADHRHRWRRCCRWCSASRWASSRATPAAGATR